MYVSKYSIFILLFINYIIHILCITIQITLQIKYIKNELTEYQKYENETRIFINLNKYSFQISSNIMLYYLINITNIRNIIIS